MTSVFARPAHRGSPPRALRQEFFMNTKRFVTAVALLVVFSGCSQNRAPEWLIGEWVVDTETTQENIQSSPSQEQPLTNAISGLQAMLVPLLSGMELAISPKTLITSFQGQKKLTQIQVYQSEPDKVTLIDPDGLMKKYHRIPGGFWIASDDGRVKIFFKKKGM